MPEEILVLPGEWNVGDVVTIQRGDELLVSGRIKEVVRAGVYKIDVEKGGIAERARKSRPR